MPCGGLRASERNELSFPRAIEFSGHRRVLTGFALQGHRQAFEHQGFAGAFNGDATDIKGRANLLVRPSGALRTLIRLE